MYIQTNTDKSYATATLHMPREKTYDPTVE